jgi:hypothetical protein
MSGKNEGLFRRRRTKYRKDDAFKKRRGKEILDFRIDYSDDQRWQTAIGRVAIAQDKIGVKSAMACMESVIRDIEYRREGYVYCSPAQLEEALKRMRKIYLQIKESERIK